MPLKENLPEGYLSKYVVRIGDRTVHLPKGGKRPPTTPKALLCPVSGCPWSFDNRHGLRVHGDMHLTRKQIEERMHKCEKTPGCDFATLKQHNLNNHQKHCGQPQGAPKTASKPKRTRTKGPPLESRQMQTPSTVCFECEYFEMASSSSYPAGREIISSMTSGGSGYSSHKFVYYVPSSHSASGSSAPLKLLYPGNTHEARASRKMYCGSCGRSKRCA
ncbi:hypothetical protein FB45DRAFT_1064158 [Roridomyces roridus]|uniref:C2H2-type domain-containing protein n=1 Tax=Roridomyces roridus TaxID=1738132 RepID=A0AAD7BBT7_9AGAR|nr:hypothetical protein FB45DRAFT_1064158 [Roridomyces roridus]